MIVATVLGWGNSVFDQRRREFITLLGGAAAWPLAARAQQPAMPVIGFLRSSTIVDVPHIVTAFRQGLKKTDFIEGENVAIDFRAAENDQDRLKALVAEFIRRPVSVIIANQAAALAAQSATSAVPIVFATGADPVRDGLVTTLNRPGGNVTGAVFFGAVVGSKRLDLLRQIVPTATTIGLLVGLQSPETTAERGQLQRTAQTMGLRLIIAEVNSEADLEQAFESFVQHGAGALISVGGAFIFSSRNKIAALAARHRLPTIYANREIVVAGGLMSYGASITDAYHQAGVYAGRILKGEKPGDLPIVQATKLELVINLQSAKALGIDVPPTLLALADEVIE
jgi:putative ABC transport system substrate-binding protein